MDCLRSVRPGCPCVAGPVLEGLCGMPDCAPPKKSKPNKLSPGLVCLGAAAGAFGGPIRFIVGSAVFGRAGIGPEGSPNKSTSWGLVLGG